jgi:hypothetical protein
MYKNFNRNLKKRFVFPKTTQSNPALSKKQEKVLYYFTIVGTIASTLLAIVSIFLTVNISRQSTKIEKMDSLLNLMATQNKYQNENIRKLTDLQNSSIGLSEKLSEQITSTKEQTNFLQDNSAPDIALGTISFSKSNMKQEENILRYDFNNIGGRRLKDLHSQVLMFLPTPNIKDSLYYLLTFTPNISDGNTTDLKPNSRNFHYISIPTHKVLDSIFTNCFVAVVVDYKDPLNNRTIYKPFFYQNMTGLNGNLISIYAPPKQVRIMTNYIDTAKAFKNVVKRKLMQF